MVPEGNVIYKVKTGVKPHHEDLDHLAAIRKEFGDKVDLRVDYNQALAPFGAIKILRDIEEFAPTFIEQPVPRKFPDVMAQLTAALETPVLADESCFDRRDMTAAMIIMLRITPLPSRKARFHHATRPPASDAAGRAVPF